MPRDQKLLELLKNNGIVISDSEYNKECAIIEFDYDINLFATLVDVITSAEKHIREKFPFEFLQYDNENVNWYLPTTTIKVGMEYPEGDSGENIKVRTVICILMIMQRDNIHCDLTIDAYSDLIAGLLNIKLLEGTKS